MSGNYLGVVSVTHAKDVPEPGDLVPFRHVVWRVLTVEPVPEVDWTDGERHDRNLERRPIYLLDTPHVLIARPVDDDPQPTCTDRDVHLRVNKARALPHYPDRHYPVCADCRQPMPCQDQINARRVDAAIKEMERYSFPGVCPACGETVTTRQWSGTYSDNRVVPGGPPVTFHLRKRCEDELASYLRKPPNTQEPAASEVE